MYTWFFRPDMTYVYDVVGLIHYSVIHVFYVSFKAWGLPPVGVVESLLCTFVNTSKAPFLLGIRFSMREPKTATLLDVSLGSAASALFTNFPLIWGVRIPSVVS
eukprot:GHVR01132992.1.p1 GENE.GHVR01132992.1~~GHVR01132992.1.p1  ORF type:complete len:104 (-),score=4.32 GHVR01132992.1:698-1009(-)